MKRDIKRPVHLQIFARPLNVELLKISGTVKILDLKTPEVKGSGRQLQRLVYFWPSPAVDQAEIDHITVEKNLQNQLWSRWLKDD